MVMKKPWFAIKVLNFEILYTPAWGSATGNNNKGNLVSGAEAVRRELLDLCLNQLCFRRYICDTFHAS